MSVEVLDSATAMLGALGPGRGALHGLPITVKDCFATAGIRSTARKQGLVDHVPGEGAVAVARLRRLDPTAVAQLGRGRSCTECHGDRLSHGRSSAVILARQWVPAAGRRSHSRRFC